MSTQPQPVPLEFLLKQIQNEINASFALVDAAVNAYRLQKFAEKRTASDGAMPTRQPPPAHGVDSPLVQIQSVKSQLAELREAVEYLYDRISAESK